MQQLTIQDAGFLYQESENTPMHICGIGIFEGSTRKEKGGSREEAVAYLTARMHHAPILKQKLLPCPLGLERPYWIEDWEFDPLNHIFHETLPKPGTRQMLASRISEILSAPLDMARPLWSMHIIEGLNDPEGAGNNGFALVTKIHHSCVDGESGGNLYASFVDLSPEAPPSAPDTNSGNSSQKPRIPGRYEMLATAYGRNTLDAFGQTRAVMKRLPELSRIASAVLKREIDPGAKVRVPATRFNRTPEKARVVNFTDIDIATIKAIRKAAPGTTINDVVVCIIAGAMRRFLTHHHELPTASLGAMLPKNIRSADERKNKSGNRVGGLLATIHTDIADPKARLLAISNSTRKAKEFAELADTSSLFPHLMGGSLNPFAGKGLARLIQQNRIMEKIGPMVVNTVITNVPGPDFDLYHAGARQHLFLALPPLTDGIGIGHGIYSYRGRMSISIISCPSMVGDGSFYMECCQQEFRALAEATGVTRA